MSVARRSLAVCTGVCLMVLMAVAAPVALAEGSSSVAEYGRSLRGNPLAMPWLQWLLGDRGLEAVGEAQRFSPQAVLAREESLTRYAHLDASQAAGLARKTFPVLVGEPAGGPPRLKAGQRLIGFTNADVARLSLPGHERGVVESSAPMARETSRGHFAPINLALKRTRRGYMPVLPGVAVQLPKRVGNGVKAPATRVSLTPVDARGGSVGGAEGIVDGASVIYPNTQTATDTVAKPTSTGFEVSSILRSVDSPRELYYRVGMPSGARLVQHRGGPVRVVEDGTAIAMVFPPSARDAAGTQVPVSMSAKGSTLVVRIGGGPKEYQRPIEVDPELATTEDRSLTGGVWPVTPYKGGTNWLPIHSSAFHTEGEEHSTYTKHYSCGTETYWCEQSWYIEPIAAYNASEYAGLQYETQGESKLYRLEAWIDGNDDPSETHTVIEFLTHEGKEQTNVAPPLSVGPYYKFEPAIVGPGGTGEPSETPAGNVARIMDYTTKHESIYGFWTYIWAARAFVAQEKGPETSFNTTSPTITKAEGRANVLYGSGSWLSSSQGAYEVTGHDPGIGVSFAAVSGAGMSSERFIRNEEGACKGIQCSETYSSGVTYLPSMANGEDSIEFFAEDAAGLYGYTYKTIKVDNAKPYNIRLKGMPEEGAEISAAPHTLTFEATDGTKPTKSSGMKSITVSVDGGQPAEVPGASCALGECTGKGEWTLHAEGLTEGVHRMTVTATDNAGNKAAEDFFFDVRHAAPVAVGPGSVDPTTGQFSISATDVSLSGVSGVSRTYQSRNLTAGVEGPLGPQWAINLGAGEGLSVLPTGGVVLGASGGGVTTFTRNEKGEYESPQGDSNLKVEAKEKEKGKGITEYVIEDASAGTATHFTQPAGERPSFTGQFGAEAGQLKQPVSESLDSSGNLWVSDFANSRIAKFSSTGLLMATYGSYGSEAGQFKSPWGIAVNQSTGNVYVTDQGNYRVEELSSSGTFIRSFGEKGTSTGQFGLLAGLAVDSSGNVWAVDNGNNRVEEFNEKGEYQKTIGSEGSGNGQFKQPFNIAFSGSSMYVTDYGNNRVEKFSMAGAYESQFGKTGSGNGEFKSPYGIASEPGTGNLYVVDSGNKRVQEFKAAGTFITKFGTSGSGNGQFVAPSGVAVSTAGNIYVADAGGGPVEEWARSTWLPTIGEGPITSGSTTYSYQAAEVGEEVILEPAQALAPAPPGVSCAPKLEKGCRALTFNYASSTTATGEKMSQWGDYKGYLTRVYFTAWDPAKGAMTETVVAQYAYDSKGRLRAEWDPRISPALKTIYGYDAEGHITAVTRAGQETLALAYGTLAGDSNTGRLLKATRAPATNTLWNGEPVSNSEAPKLSGTAVVGVTLGVSNGSWSNEPVGYAYQWEDCNSSGGECTPILGATNANYTATSSDVGHTLVAQVTATNGGGSVLASSAHSAVIASTGTKTEGTHYTPRPGSTIEYHVPVSGTGAPYNLSEGEASKWAQTKDLPAEGMAIFPPDEPQSWPATDYKRATIRYLDAEGRLVNTAGPTGGISTIEYSATNAPTRILSADNRVSALKETCESKEKCKSAEVSTHLDTENTYSETNGELLETLGPEHKVKLASGTEVLARNHMVYHYNEGAPENGELYSLVTKTTDGAQYEGKEADVRTTLTSYAGQKGLGWKLRKPTSVTKDPTGLNLTTTTEYSEATGNVIATRTPAGSSEAVSPPAFSASVGSKGSGNGQFNRPESVALDASGNIWVDDRENSRIEKLSSSGEFLAAYGSLGSGSGQFSGAWALAVNQSTGNVYVSDSENNRVEELSSTGEFVEVFGWGVSDGKSEFEICKTSCKTGLNGPGNGQLGYPRGLALDAKGDVWITDERNKPSTGVLLIRCLHRAVWQQRLRCGTVHRTSQHHDLRRRPLCARLRQQPRARALSSRNLLGTIRHKRLGRRPVHTASRNRC
jgi:sugar lactone lactonase YvrE